MCWDLFGPANCFNELPLSFLSLSDLNAMSIYFEIRLKYSHL